LLERDGAGNPHVVEEQSNRTNPAKRS
jgi:hypothetical protein